MVKRKRDIQIKFRVDEEELDIINKKVEKSKLNKEQYLRKMSIDGCVLIQDLESIRGLTNEINKIGVNINQIAKVMNETGAIYQNDIKSLKGKMDDIWQLLKSTLSK